MLRVGRLGLADERVRARASAVPFGATCTQAHTFGTTDILLISDGLAGLLQPPSQMRSVARQLSWTQLHCTALDLLLGMVLAR